MIYNHNQYVQEVKFEGNDEPVQKLKANLESQGIRVVFVSQPVVEDDGATKAMKSMKWGEDHLIENVHRFMFPTSVNPMTADVIDRSTAYFETVFEEFEKTVVDSECKTFYFYAMSCRTVIDAQNNGTLLEWLFRGLFDEE